MGIGGLLQSCLSYVLHNVVLFKCFLNILLFVFLFVCFCTYFEYAEIIIKT